MIEPLADAVIAKAWEDAVTTLNYQRRFPQDVDEAWWFLTDNFGEWAESREVWCDAAGRNAESLRLTALAHAADYLAVLAAVEAHYEERKQRAVAHNRAYKARQKDAA